MGLSIARWGQRTIPMPRDRQDRINPFEVVVIDTGPRQTRMAHSVATGTGLVSNGDLGVDAIRLSAGQGFTPHTHPGDHILIVVAGEGTITVDGAIHRTEAGQVYMIPGLEPHAVGAITDHVILAVGAPHKRVDDDSRMAPVEYQSVTADLGSLRCTICDVSAAFPELPHGVGCRHCPCPACITTGDREEDRQLRAAFDERRRAAGWTPAVERV